MQSQRLAGSPLWKAARFVFAAAILSALLVGCAESPEAFVSRFERALSTGDTERVASMLTPDSRPLYRAIVASGDEEKTNPFLLPREVSETAAVESAVHMEGGGVMIRLRAKTIEREWVLSRAGTRYQLDLISTATRRPWTSE